VTTLLDGLGIDIPNSYTVSCGPGIMLKFVTFRAVELDFRAYDTRGEATVIFTSIIGAYVLLRHVGRKPDAGHDTNR